MISLPIWLLNLDFSLNIFVNGIQNDSKKLILKLEPKKKNKNHKLKIFNLSKIEILKFKAIKFPCNFNILREIINAFNKRTRHT